jgi:hypothetical protein
MEDGELNELRSEVKDIHRMVAKIYKYQKRQAFFRILKTIFIFVIIVGAYYALSPVFTRLADTYNNVSNSFSNFGNTVNSVFGQDQESQ